MRLGARCQGAQGYTRGVRRKARIAEEEEAKCVLGGPDLCEVDHGTVFRIRPKIYVMLKIRELERDRNHTLSGRKPKFDTNFGKFSSTLHLITLLN